MFARTRSRPTCSAPQCWQQVSRDDHYICRDHWNEVCAKVERVLAQADVAYIGRSHDPSERIKAHMVERGLTNYRTVFVASSADEAMALEEALIARYQRLARWRLDNRSEFSGGSIREGRNCLYVAFRR